MPFNPFPAGQYKCQRCGKKEKYPASLEHYCHPCKGRNFLELFGGAKKSIRASDVPFPKGSYTYHVYLEITGLRVTE